jgi:hypothetical protein
MTKFLKTLRAILERPGTAIWILALACLIRLVWVFSIEIEPIIDFKTYFERGQEIAQGEGYHEGDRPTAWFPVGYPAFLAILFSIFPTSVTTVELSNVALQLIAIWFSGLIAFNIWNQRAIMNLTMLLLACWPNHLAYCSIIATESLFSALSLAAVYCLMKGRERLSFSMVSGILFGLSALVKTQAILLPAVLFGSWFICRIWKNPGLVKTLIIRGALTYIIMLSVILPWSLRNYKTFGQFVLISTNGGINLFIGNNPISNGCYTLYQDQVEALGETRHEAELDKKASQAAWKYIQDHPGHFTRLMRLKLYHLYYTDTEGLGWIQQAYTPMSPPWTQGMLLLRVLNRGFYYVIIACSLIWVVLQIKCPARMPADKDFCWFGLGMILFITALYILFFGNPRFHYPLIPWMIMYTVALIYPWIFKPEIVKEHNVQS